MNTDILSPVRGEDTEGEGHWWLIDNNNGDIIDLTKDQYQTNELNGVYSLGKKSVGIMDLRKHQQVVSFV